MTLIIFLKSEKENEEIKLKGRGKYVTVIFFSLLTES